MPHESLLMGKVKAMTTIALNVLDELYLHLDRDAEPWSVQLEVGVDGRVDADRLAAAILEGARRHPLARARLCPARGIDFGYEWEVTDELAEAPLEVADCDGDEALATARERLMRTSRGGAAVRDDARAPSRRRRDHAQPQPRCRGRD